jgi:hypothetical protein
MTLLQTLRDGKHIRAPRMRLNWRVFWIGQAWWLFETCHFGWNFAPTSDAEIICDGIVALITALAFAIPPVGKSGG